MGLKVSFSGDFCISESFFCFFFAYGFLSLGFVIFSFREGLQESICSELMGTAYWTELVIRFKDSKTRQRSIHLYWWVSASFHWHFRSFYFAFFVLLSRNFWCVESGARIF